MEMVKTEIDGLEIHLERVFGDGRGILAELLPDGARNPFVSERGIGNVYASIATGRHIARAAHFHFKNHEIFYTLTGTALWLFHDFRENSRTAGKNFGVVLGFDAPADPVPHQVYVLGEQKMAGISVPVGVYHAFWPLTQEKVVTVAVASVPHDDADYDRRSIREVPGFQKILAEYGITAD
jgi:dTDP-4-dehydrorhamnose 3,5-epimerase-like enzyme